MQIVQTFWNSKPDRKSLMELKAGWLSPMFHYMGWALSCIQLRKYYGDLCLYTNESGRYHFEEVLKLPYETVELDFNFRTFPKELWALSKVHVYQQQTRPFLHIDGDIFIWEALDIHPYPQLVVQNIEEKFGYNFLAVAKAREFGMELPHYLLPIMDEEGVPDSINAGVIGGHDLPFIWQYTEEAFRFFEKNEDIFNSRPITNHFNCLVEQILFYGLAVRDGKHLDQVLKEKVESNDYSGFANFEGVPVTTTYIHPVGTYKRNRIVCQQLAERLELDYPDIFSRIISLFREEYNYWFKMQRIHQKHPNDWLNCKL
jgi:hypothetical protein